MDATTEQAVRDAVETFGEPPRIVLTGKTGSGKSSLVNALLGRAAQRTDVVPCTQDADSADLDWHTGDAHLKLLDVPGFAEADRHAKRVEFILQNLPSTHLGLLVVGAPDRALEFERQFLEDVSATDPGFPVIVVANKIDLLPPVREWSPKTLNLRQPSTAKELNVTAWVGEVRRATGGRRGVVPVVSGERFDALDEQYGLHDLSVAVYDALPEAARNSFARVSRIQEIRSRSAAKAIWLGAGAAAAAALQPLPVADAVVITPIQVAMIVKIALIYGAALNWRAVLTMLEPALMALAGPLAVKELAKFIPGFGSAIGAGVAGVTTLAIGWTFEFFFMRGNFQPSKKEIVELLREQYEKAKNYKAQVVEEAKRGRQP